MFYPLFVLLQHLSQQLLPHSSVSLPGQFIKAISVASFGETGWEQRAWELRAEFSTTDSLCLYQPIVHWATDKL